MSSRFEGSTARAITGPLIVAIVGAILVLVAGIPTGGFGFGSRLSGGRRGRTI